MIRQLPDFNMPIIHYITVIHYIQIFTQLGKINYNTSTLEVRDRMKIYWNGHSKNIIGNRLKELRTAQGISQKTLAARLQTEGFEFTDLTILRIEQGKRFVPDYEIVAIANYFHISTDYLLGATDIK